VPIYILIGPTTTINYVTPVKEMNKIYFYVKALPVMVLSNFHRVTTTGSPSQILIWQHNCLLRVEPRLALVYFLPSLFISMHTLVVYTDNTTIFGFTGFQMHMFEYHKNKGGNDEFYPSQIYNFIRSLFRVSIDFKCLLRGKCYRQDIVVESAKSPQFHHFTR
jgi:hypothetical protein